MKITMLKLNKINPRAIAFGLVLNSIIFMMAAFVYATVIGAIFGVAQNNLVSQNSPPSNSTNHLFMLALCGGWLVLKALCEFAAGAITARNSSMAFKVNITTLSCFSLAFTIVWLIFVADVVKPLRTPIWYILASLFVTFTMPAAGALLLVKRLAKHQEGVASPMPPIPGVPHS